MSKSKELKLINTYPFSSSAKTEAPEILNGKDVKEWLLSKYDKGCIFGLDNLMNHGCYKIGGWSYRFNMSKYLYKQHGRWIEAYAPNKTALRKAVHGAIDKIILLED